MRQTCPLSVYLTNSHATA